MLDKLDVVELAFNRAQSVKITHCVYLYLREGYGLFRRLTSFFFSTYLYMQAHLSMSFTSTKYLASSSGISPVRAMITQY